MRALIVSFLLMSLGLSDGLSHDAKADMARLLRDGPLARDYVNNLEWMRCSVGQVWESDTCAGEILMLSVPEAHEVVARIKSLEGGGWRLPTARELQLLVSKVENRPDDFDANIDLETFPNTFAVHIGRVIKAFIQQDISGQSIFSLVNAITAFSRLRKSLCDW